MIGTPPDRASFVAALIGVVVGAVLVVVGASLLAGCPAVNAAAQSAGAPVPTGSSETWSVLGQVIGAAVLSIGSAGIAVGGARRFGAAVGKDPSLEANQARLDERTKATNRRLDAIDGRLHNQGNALTWTQGAMYAIADKLDVQLAPFTRAPPAKPDPDSDEGKSESGPT